MGVLHKNCMLVCQHSVPLVPIFPGVTGLFLVVSQTFLAVTGVPGYQHVITASGVKLLHHQHPQLSPSVLKYLSTSIKSFNSSQTLFIFLVLLKYICTCMRLNLIQNMQMDKSKDYGLVSHLFALISSVWK